MEMIILREGLTYEQALDALKNQGAIITRPVWKGYHFRYFEHYGIRLESGEIILNPDEIYDTDKKDWMIVDIRDEREIKAVYKKITEEVEKLK